MSTTVQMSQHIVVGHVLVAIGIAITALISYIVLRAATRLDKVLGATGMNAMARIMGFLLICIGIQFVINGVLGVVGQCSQVASVGLKPDSTSESAC